MSHEANGSGNSYGVPWKTSAISSGIPLLLTTNETVEHLEDSVINATQISATQGLKLDLKSDQVRIALYSVIFVLSLLGNGLVIVTLAQNKRMRTVTNVLLLNLAVSDLLLSLFCMPVTLAGALLREFIFGQLMCKLIPFLQAVSVSVSVWTLVAISLERYFAICRPLRSRTWQTLSHAYKMIVVIWSTSVLWMIPIAVMSQLLPMKNSGKFKCRENWPNPKRERAFTIFLDIILLLIPLIVMILAYCLISRTLWLGIRREMMSKCTNLTMTVMHNKDDDPHTSSIVAGRQNGHWPAGRKRICRYSRRQTPSFTQSSSVRISQHLQPQDNCSNRTAESVQSAAPVEAKPFRRLIRRTNLEKGLSAKRRVIRMLFVVVLEFFICWSPLYVINTLSLFSPKTVYTGLGSTGISLFQLLAYFSSCCNPITYCFMHKKFRQAFLAAFGCRHCRRRRSPVFVRGSECSAQDNSFYFSRQSTFKTVIAERNDTKREVVSSGALLNGETQNDRETR